MNRRDFLKTASGVTGAAAVAGAAPPAVAQEGGQENGTTTSGNGTAGNGTDGNETAGGGAGGGSETVALTGDNVYDPAELYIAPGTTVTFDWTSDGHNIIVDSKPEDSDWEGHEPIENEGFTHEHTFEVLGDYEYYCSPHQSLGMEAVIHVTEGGQNPNAGGGGGGEVDPHELGVPFQAHFVGIATLLAVFVSLVYSFYVLKYGESPHSSSPNRR
ncbi:plastocyanin/azurin family copper-binding protein [Halostella litorea]|uniref:plastocyanin/azurin family copper-binding protein n=1 Tax=Halostella litorea TaxID=2528831 RepID=UPI0010921EC0|nr:plastocyanin/azurin family copper-binding protein [Halostella litorea]